MWSQTLPMVTMRVLGLCFAVLLALAAFGCAEFEPPEQEVPPLARVELYPSHPLNVLTGDTIVFEAIGRDPAGEEQALTAPPTWSLTPSSIGTVSRDGVLAVSQAMHGWLRVQVGQLTDSVALQALRKEEGAYHITLRYAADVAPAWRAAAEYAARRWEETVSWALPATPRGIPDGACTVAPGEPAVPSVLSGERGTVIYVGQSSAFPVTPDVPMVGGPCLMRELPLPTTIIGALTINRRFGQPITPEFRRWLLAHEMGHALGLVALVNGPQPPWFDLRSMAYSGSMGMEGLRRLGRRAFRSVGAQGAHWGFVAPGDVMGGGGDIGLAVISTASIGALRDLGYASKWSAAGGLGSAPER